MNKKKVSEVTSQSPGPFGDKKKPPGPDEVDKELGKSARLWRKLIAEISLRHVPIEEFWNFGVKFGWSLRLKRKDRVVIYLIPQQGGFLAGIVLGDKALRSVEQQDLPAAVRKIIEAAPRYGEGTGIRMAVKNQTDLKSVLKLVASKMET